MQVNPIGLFFTCKIIDLDHYLERSSVHRCIFQQLKPALHVHVLFLFELCADIIECTKYSMGFLVTSYIDDVLVNLTDHKEQLQQVFA